MTSECYIKRSSSDSSLRNEWLLSQLQRQVDLIDDIIYLSSLRTFMALEAAAHTEHMAMPSRQTPTLRQASLQLMCVLVAAQRLRTDEPPATVGACEDPRWLRRHRRLQPEFQTHTIVLLLLKLHGSIYHKGEVGMAGDQRG